MLAPAVASTTSIASATVASNAGGGTLQGDLGVAARAASAVDEPSVRRKTQKFVERNGSPFQPTLFVEGEAEAVSMSVLLPRLAKTMQPQIEAAVPQIWEGTVLAVNEAGGSLRASLRAKRGEIEDHVGEIAFEWVMDQDRDLVAPGAVFYLTIYKSRLRGGTVLNSQELRFRRLPAWTKQQVAKVQELAESIAKKMKARPLAE